jgi:hypothetical protein
VSGVFTGVDRQGAMFAVHSKKRAAAAKTAAPPKKIHEDF